VHDETLQKDWRLRTRIYLTGKLWVEAGDSFIDESMFPSRQGRVAFAYLAIEHDRPVPREELADAIWLEDLPPGWEGALSAIVSKLRTLLKHLGPAAPEITIAAGSHQLRAPSAPWIDVEVAESSIAKRKGCLETAGRVAPGGPPTLRLPLQVDRFCLGKNWDGWRRGGACCRTSTCGRSSVCLRSLSKTGSCRLLGESQPKRLRKNRFGRQVIAA
jgi:hypothetical protein